MAAPTLRELLARLEEQQARIERLEATTTAPASTAVVGEPAAEAEPEPQRMTRRGMLTTAAVGTLGLVGAALIESEGTAAAAGPGAFTSATTTPAVQATNTGAGQGILATAGQVTAIHGSQTSAKAGAIAVRGTIDSKTPGLGIGVEGVAASGMGVAGYSTAGTGVFGASTTGSGMVGTSGATTAHASAVHGTITSTTPGDHSAGVVGKNSGTASNGIGVYGTHAGAGSGVLGSAVDGTGVVGVVSNGVGVHGSSDTGGYGVIGATNDGTGYGVYGVAAAGIGVIGTAGAGTGVYGGSGTGVGVKGVSNSTNAVEGDSTSGTGVSGNSSSGYGVYGHSPNNYGVIGVTTAGNGVYGQVSTSPQSGIVGRTLDASGNWALYGFGNIGATGTKSAVVPAADGLGHMTLYCVESPECWFEDFGSGRLAGGTASVAIDPEFAQTVETGQYHVFVQAEGECNGLRVGAKTATGFVVTELGGGKSNVPFSYRIVALRKDVTAPRLNRISLPEAATKLH